jgi:predicted metal-dependent hydrolase
MHIMSKVENWNVIIEGVEHPCKVEWKSKRTIRYSVRRDGFTLYVSAPYGTSKEYLRKGIQMYIPKLLKKFNYEKPSNTDDEVYIFGEKAYLPDWNQLSEKGQASYLNKKLLAYVEPRTKELADLMGIKTPYKIKVRNMSSRYGVNSSATTSITYSTILVHYSKPIIDSVIFHELTHDRVRNHSSRFYDELYKYSPDYDQLHGKLRKHQYK